MPEPVTCLDCGMMDPPPEQTCTPEVLGGRDHFIGADHERACPHCGRLMLACARRPCSAVRAAQYGAEDDGSDEGEAGSCDAS